MTTDRAEGMSAALDTAEGERLLAKATPGPWAIDDDERPGMSWNAHIVADDGGDMRIAFMTHDGTQANSECLANAALIVYAVNNLPALLSAVAALERERDELRRLCGLDCDADPENGHSVISQPDGYQFCHKCGITIKEARRRRAALPARVGRDQ